MKQLQPSRHSTKVLLTDGDEKNIIKELVLNQFPFDRKDQVKSGQGNPLRELWLLASNKILIHVKNQKKSWSRPVAPPDPRNMQTLKKT
ncbi:hypothetical protein P5673_031333 [Acropora cervicornis]|uniref:Uncharacterized protein n=1 Tax=Acropora cervicornis TaxID=6130 RepID=A0AAD9PT23_ACRCE|nr:hypothetical protein P5673_031333 [Acropora cervicornis]